ncbi:MAG: copper homeostasis protein CutC, partial [Aeromonas sp.]
MTRLEVCIDNLESLLTAQQSGADRIELCSALGLGGLTPSYGFMQLAARHATVPVYAMIRPRAGDFCFSDDEFEMMLQDIAAARTAGLHGVVVGLLDEKGRVPAVRLTQLVVAAGSLGVTFHRAIDLCSDWRADIEVIIAAGCERILSSGHAPSALAGLETLQEMQQALAGRAT